LREKKKGKRGRKRGKRKKEWVHLSMMSFQIPTLALRSLVMEIEQADNGMGASDRLMFGLIWHEYQ
jgi:hypothetical protein